MIARELTITCRALLTQIMYHECCSSAWDTTDMLSDCTVRIKCNCWLHWLILSNAGDAVIWRLRAAAAQQPAQTPPGSLLIKPYQETQSNNIRTQAAATTGLDQELREVLTTAGIEESVTQAFINEEINWFDFCLLGSAELLELGIEDEHTRQKLLEIATSSMAPATRPIHITKLTKRQQFQLVLEKSKEQIVNNTEPQAGQTNAVEIDLNQWRSERSSSGYRGVYSTGGRFYADSFAESDGGYADAKQAAFAYAKAHMASPTAGASGKRAWADTHFSTSVETDKLFYSRAEAEQLAVGITLCVADDAGRWASARVAGHDEEWLEVQWLHFQSTFFVRHDDAFSLSKCLTPALANKAALSIREHQAQTPRKRAKAATRTNASKRLMTCRKRHTRSDGTDSNKHVPSQTGDHSTTGKHTQDPPSKPKNAKADSSGKAQVSVGSAVRMPFSSRVHEVLEDGFAIQVTPDQ